MANTKNPPPTVQKKPVVIGGNVAPSSGGAGSTPTSNVSPPADPITITKFQFRKLFTLAERMEIDNASSNPNLSAQAKKMLVVLENDLIVSTNVVLNSADVIAGVDFMVNCQLLTAERARQILSNTIVS